jgi:hypothetical protein
MQVWRLRARRTCARALPPERLASCADGLVFACIVGYVDELLLLTDDFGIALASIGRPQGLAGVLAAPRTTHARCMQAQESFRKLTMHRLPRCGRLSCSMSGPSAFVTVSMLETGRGGESTIYYQYS